MSFKITLMTGSEYEFCVKYGEIDTPYSLLPMLYGRLLGGDAELRHIVETYKLRSRHRGGLAQAWQDWLLTLFRGTAFYIVGEGEEEQMSSLHDLPVQPEDGVMCEWDADILWQLITRRAQEAAERAQARMRTSTGKHSAGAAIAATSKSFSGDDPDDGVDDFIGLRLVLRRRVGASTELLAGQLELFADQVADNDLVVLRGMWHDWLAGSKPLPADHVRVDLLYAEETRCVNSRVYHSEDECFYYLLGMQLAISWESRQLKGSDEYLPVEPAGEDAHVWPTSEWGCEGVTSVLADCDLSIRPIHSKPHNFKSSLHSSRGSQSSGSRGGRRASKVTRLSTFFRRSIMGPSEVQRIGEHYRRRLTLKDAGSFALYGDAFGKKRDMRDGGSVRSDSEASGTSLLDYNDDEGSEFYETSDSDSSYDTDKSEHNPSSPDTSDSENEKERKKAATLTREREKGIRPYGRAPIVSYSDLYKHEKVELAAKLRSMGIDEETHGTVDLERIIDWTVKFHQITDQPSGPIGTDSPQYRYLLKRAYLHYLQTWPLYGFHFSEAVLLDGAHGQRNVLVGVSPNGLMLLDPKEWTVVLRASLHDIEQCELRLRAKDDFDDEDEDEDEDDQDLDDLGPADDFSDPRSSESGSSSVHRSRRSSRSLNTPPPDPEPSDSTYSDKSSESSSRSSYTSETGSSRGSMSGSSRSSDSHSSTGRRISKSRRASRKSKLSSVPEDDDGALVTPPESEFSESDSYSSGMSGAPSGQASDASDSGSSGSGSGSGSGGSSDSDDDYSLPDDTQPASDSDLPENSSQISSPLQTAKSSRTGKSSRSGKSGAMSAFTKSGIPSPSSASVMSVKSGGNKGGNIEFRHEKLLRNDHIVLTINGDMTLRLVGTRASEQRRMLEQCSLEVLGRGIFPHGSEGGVDLPAPGEAMLAAHDTKEIMRKFVRDFPILPIPPTPPALSAAPDYRDIPKSKIQAKLEEREESDRLERENAALARDKLEEKMKKERKELARGLGSDEDEEDEDDTAPDPDAEPDETVLNALVSRAVCGVGRAGVYIRSIPPVPVRRGGRLIMDSQVGRVPDMPELAVLEVPHPSALPPVGTSWGSAADEPVAATPSRYSPMHSPKKTRGARLAAPRWTEHTSQYLERSNKLLEAIVESETLIGEQRNREKNYFTGSTSKRRKKKEKKTTSFH